MNVGRETSPPVSVLIVDDNAVVRSGLRGLLERSPRVHVVGEAWDGERAVHLVRALLPDVVLLDVRMPRRDGVSVAREIASVSRVLMMTFTDDPQVVREAVEAGALGYLVHGSFEVDDLVSNIVAVSRGAGVFSPEALGALRSPAPAPRRSPAERAAGLGLTARQAEVMDLIAGGLTNGEIARQIFLSEKTVKNHINRIFAVLGARSRGEAIARWIQADDPGPRLGPGLGPWARASDTSRP